MGNDEALAVQETALVLPNQDRLTAVDIIARTALVRQVMEAVMIEGVHYGKIPGTQKVSLWQPGAEKLLMTFQLAPYPEIEDLATPDEIRYRVVCVIKHIPTGEIVGAGVGEASSNEEKYRWRAAVCQEEFDETPVDRRRRKWKKGWNGSAPTTVNQVRTEPADIANTVLKMATKRAKVDGAKSTCAASDLFEQDLEDLVAAGYDIGRDAKPEVQAPQANDPPQGGPNGEAPQGGETITDPDTADLWQTATDRWHERGTISEAQMKRLFAIAASNGWESDQVKGLVAAHLNGVSVKDICWGDPYEAIVKVFQTTKPESAEADAQQDHGAAPPAAGDELPPITDDDIPFDR